jgi:hypothetical protein
MCSPLNLLQDAKEARISQGQNVVSKKTTHITPRVTKNKEVSFSLESEFLGPISEYNILSPGKPGIGKISIQPIIDNPIPARDKGCTH